MKNVIAIFAIWLVLSSCTYNSEEELGIIIPGELETLVDYQAQVKPILIANCAISKTCHGTNSVTLLELNDDQQVVKFSPEIKEEVLSGRMPRTGSLTFEEKDLLISWINQGSNLN